MKILEKLLENVAPPKWLEDLTERVMAESAAKRTEVLRFEIAKMELREGDVLVVRLPREFEEMPAMGMARVGGLVKAGLEKRLNIPVLVTGHDMDFEVVRDARD